MQRIGKATGLVCAEWDHIPQEWRPLRARPSHRQFLCLKDKPVWLVYKQERWTEKWATQTALEKVHWLGNRKKKHRECVRPHERERT